MTPGHRHVRMTTDAQHEFAILNHGERLLASERLRKIANHPDLMGALGAVGERGVTTRRTKMFGVTFFMVFDPRNDALVVTRVRL